MEEKDENPSQKIKETDRAVTDLCVSITEQP